MAQRRKMGSFTCKRTGKIGYRTETDAQRALDSTRKIAGRSAKAGHGSARRERRYYECDWCPGWHLTSERERVFYNRDEPDAEEPPEGS